MCGIAGFIDYKRRWGRRELEKIVGDMASTVRHRGPDDSGTWVDETAGIAFGHRRLSIIDLSPEGHQPMVSESGRYVIIYNGEVYNFPTLKKILMRMGYLFRGGSDTEVVLASFEHWGVDKAVEMLEGMFAFALLDRSDKRLHLVRDRIGIKPLFYGWMDGQFIFGSELKIFRSSPCWDGKIDRDVLQLYMQHSYIPAPHTIYKGIYKLFPGCVLSLDVGGGGSRPNDFSPFPVHDEADICMLQPRPYWSIRKVAEEARINPFKGDEEEGVNQLQKILTRAVSDRMIADVPLGAFLSGGIDSAVVVALMQSASTNPVKTFTVGFLDSRYNEAEYARTVADYLGTDHTEVFVSHKEAIDVIPRLPMLYDEPFGDSSQIPTFMICQLAREEVKVGLSGDGGDENFAGYNQYFIATSIWNKTRWLSPLMKSLIAKGMAGISLKGWETFLSYTNRLVGSELRKRLSGDAIHKAVDMVMARTPDVLFKTLTSHWKQGEGLVIGGNYLPKEEPGLFQAIRSSDFARRMMYADMVSYLPDDILVKVDRASMGVGLEARVPILDHRVVEFVARLPLNMLIRGNTRKYLLRRLLYKYVPMNLIDRPKKGFSLPLGEWLRSPLRDWAESLLDGSRLGREGYLNPATVKKKWKEHISGGRDWKNHLWNVLMFEAWLDNEK